MPPAPRVATIRAPRRCSTECRATCLGPAAAALLCGLVATIALSQTDPGTSTVRHRPHNRTQPRPPSKPLVRTDAASWASPPLDRGAFPPGSSTVRNLPHNRTQPRPPTLRLSKPPVVRAVPSPSKVDAAIRAVQAAHSKYMSKYELRKLPFTSEKANAGILSWFSCNLSNHLNASRRGWHGLDVHSVGHSQVARAPCETPLHGLSLRPNSPMGALRCAARHVTLDAALKACRVTPWCDGVTRDNGLECVGPAAFAEGRVSLDSVCVEGGQLRQHARMRTRAVRITPEDFSGPHPYLLHEVQSQVPLQPRDQAMNWRSGLAIVAWFSCEANLNHLVGETLHPVWQQLEIHAPAVVRVAGPPTPTFPPPTEPTHRPPRLLTTLCRLPGAAAPACDHGERLAGEEPLNNEVPLGALRIHREPTADPAGEGCC